MPPKRKRDNRVSVDGSRPSPHRPGDTNLGQHERDDMSGRGRGRGPRGTHDRRDSSNSNSGRTPTNQPLQAPRQGRLNSMQPPPPVSAQVPARQGEAPKPQLTSASPPRLNYSYDNLTVDRLENWATRGHQEVLQHGIQSKEDFDITELANLFQEFAHAVVEGKLDAASAGACVQGILGNGTNEIAKDSYTIAPDTLLLDSLAIVVDNNPELYQPSLGDFLRATGISIDSMRLVLDPPVLQQLGLIRENFQKVGVRQATNLLYRQANYNLLREESEGYSKLINELYPHSYSDAEQTFERVKALVGTFDLDVGRVLDIVLDVAATMLMKQYRFFVKFLRASSWWPRSRLDDAISHGLPQWALPGLDVSSVTETDKEASVEQKRERDVVLWERARELHLPAFFELAGRRLTEAETDDLKLIKGQTTGDASSDFERDWISETRTLPPPGNRIAAHLLGFKLLYYYSDSRDADEVLPANLLWLAALLIKIGFISIVDLYPHLSPSDEEMEEVRKKQMAKVEEDERALRGGPMNALLMAGELPQGDDENPTASHVRREPAKKDAEKKNAEPEATKIDNAPHEQKATLLIQLLTIGALPESLFILGRFPWMSEAFPEVLVRIHRILHVMVDKVYSSTRPVSTRPLAKVTKQMAAIDQTGMPKGSVRQKRLPSKTPMRWPHPDVIDNEENQRYHFYWEEWTDNIPVCQSVDDIFTLCSTFLNLSGVNIGKDEVLLSKLAAIGTMSLSQDSSKDNLARWHDLLKRLLVPALSHTSANASVVKQIWTLLHYYSTATRYTIYAEWFEGQTSRLPVMRTAFARATSETKAIMKRVSQATLGEMARKLAKVSNASPGTVFKVALSQLQSYNNLIEMFVECAKYFTDLSYDVLVWSLLNALGAPRSRTQQEHALSVSMWLQALSRLSGRIFRRYQDLDPVPVLQFVNQQLLQRNPTDLIIITEFVYSMGGIEESLNFTENQVRSLAGGAYLRKQTLIRAQDKRFENVRSSRRLLRALETSKLGTQLLISLAQFAQGAIFQIPEDQAHVKFLATIAEESHAVLIRYLDFLWSNLEPAAFDAFVPSIPELMATYGLDASFAFLIGRSSIAVRMFPWKPKKSLDGKDAPEISKSTATKEDDVVMTDTKPDEEPSTVEEQKPDDATMLKALQPVVGALEQSMPSGFWQKMTPEFYTAFWALQLGDLFCPDKMYKQERERLKADELAVAKDRTDMSRRAQERKMEKRKELMQLQIGLSEECGEHLLRQAKWKFQLTKLFQTSFPKPEARADSISDMLLEQCILPRALISVADAEYTFRFLKALHEWNAPGFGLMSLYDRLFNANRLRTLIFTCTTREADYLGHFLKLIMEDLAKWHKNAPVVDEADPKGAKNQPRLGAYEKEGRGTNEQARLGFAKDLDENGKPKTFIEHAEFQDILFRWHRGINTALKACLSGQEWMHIRNAIAVLRALFDFFPAVDFMAKQFMTQLQKVHSVESSKKTAEDSEEGDRVDLATAAQTAMSELQKRKSKWVMVQAFRANSNGVTGAETDKSSGTLRPTATEFKPGSRRKAPGADEEDGEVQDANESKAGGNIHGASDKKSVAPQAKTSTSSKPTHDSRREQGSAPHGYEKASTPKAAAPSPAPNNPRVNTLPDRPPQGLPTRPDVPIPPHHSDRFGSGRPSDRRDARDLRDVRNTRDTREQRDPRDPRDSRDNREHRDNRDPRVPEAERTRDHYASGRGPDLIRDVGRLDLPRPSPADRDRERPHRDSRVGRHDDREVQPVTGQSSTADAAQEPMMNPERAALFAQDGSDRTPRSADQERRARGGRTDAVAPMEAVNPERAALIGEHTQNTPTRGPRDAGRERPPRGQSPRRNGRPGNEDPSAGAQADDKHMRHPQHDPRGPPSDAWDQPQPFSAGRNDRATGRDVERTPAERMRDATIHQSPDPRNDPAPRGVHQDQNYGRLNPVPTGPEIPSGPRGRGRGSGRGGHNSPQPPPSRTDGRFDTPNNQRPGSPDRMPPTGPSSSRHRVTPLSTVTSSEETMHPDRMRAFGGTADGPRSEFSQPAAANSIHPDRFTQVRQPQQSTPVRSAPGPGRNQPPITPMTGPAGPRQSADGSGFTPTDSVVPTGPASSNERSRSGRGVRQLAGIQNTLQQASATMPEVNRSNSNGNTRRSHQQPRQTLGNSDVQILAGGSAGTTPTQERSDPTASLGLTPAEGSTGKENGRGRRDRDDRSDRSGRPSHRDRSERSRSPVREREGQETREHRDRRSGVHDNSRDERDRRMGRDVMAPPPAMGAGRDLMNPRHRQDEFPHGGSGGRSGRGGLGERREDRPREDRGRKRRSDEGLSNLSNDREKRARR